METKEVRDVYLESGYKITLNDVLEGMQASNLDGEEMLSLEDFLTQGSQEVGCARSGPIRTTCNVTLHGRDRT